MLLYLLDFLIQGTIEVTNMSLGAVDVCLIERLELEYLLTQLQIYIVEVVQLTSLLIKLLAILVHQLRHLVQIQITVK